MDFCIFANYFSNCYLSSALQFISGCHFVWYLEPIKLRLVIPILWMRKHTSVEFWLAKTAVKPNLNCLKDNCAFCTKLPTLFLSAGGDSTISVSFVVIFIVYFLTLRILTLRRILCISTELSGLFAFSLYSLFHLRHAPNHYSHWLRVNRKESRFEFSFF